MTEKPKAKIDFERQMHEHGPDSLLPDWRSKKSDTNYVYLAGAIFGLEDRGQTWRRQAIKLMPKGWTAINPELVEIDKFEPEDLIRGDYAAILSASAVIARVEQPSWGTAMEISFARQHRIPVIGWKLVHGHISSWLDYHLAVLCHSVEDAVAELKHVKHHHKEKA